jgi:hypothetical protein
VTGLPGSSSESRINYAKPPEYEEMRRFKVLQLGVPLVTATHVTRVLILVTTTALLFRLAKRLSASSA